MYNVDKKADVEENSEGSEVIDNNSEEKADKKKKRKKVNKCKLLIYCRTDGIEVCIPPPRLLFFL